MKKQVETRPCLYGGTTHSGLPFGPHAPHIWRHGNLWRFCTGFEHVLLGRPFSREEYENVMREAKAARS